jgi:glycosyltransferase involved in cell wall biosynthesis
MKVLFVEPFYGGSHRLFADRVAAFSGHEIELITLTAAFWKWRMRGAHLSLAAKIEERRGRFECLLTTDMLSLAELVGIVPWLAALPSVVYFHENQLSYPVPKGEAPDVHFGFTNISTALAADRLVFNSRFHLEEFVGGIDPFLRAMPDRRPRRLGESVRPKSSVVYPGVDGEELGRFRAGRRREKPLTILWNHRWEFDKCPEIFFRVLGRLAADGLDFRVHLLGENFQAKPKPFLEAKEMLGERIATFGFLPGREEYIRSLWDSDVVVSTAVQEFYGIAVMEAACCGCHPLLPRRLVYPELYGEECLYDGEEELEARLRQFVSDGIAVKERGGGPGSALVEEQEVRRSVHLLDRLIEETKAVR